MLHLRKDAVDLRDYGDQDDIWGTLAVIRGLKRRARKRSLPVTRAMADVLRQQMKLSECEYVFSSLRDRKQPLSGDTLGIQHMRTIRTGEFHPGSGLHALRHTFLTEASRFTQNVRALMRIARHSQVSTTMRYIHPEERDIVAISATLQRERQRREREHATAAPVPPVSVPGSPERLQKRLQ
jgi:integrase